MYNQTSTTHNDEFSRNNGSRKRPRTSNETFEDLLSELGFTPEESTTSKNGNSEPNFNANNNGNWIQQLHTELNKRIIGLNTGDGQDSGKTELPHIHITELLERISRTRNRLIHEVIGLGSDQIINKIFEIQNRIRKRSNTYIFSWHITDTQPHIHIVHQCDWKFRECRCFGFNLPFERRKSSNHWTNEITEQYWSNLLQYLTQTSRWCPEINISGKQWKSIRGIKYIPNEELHCNRGQGQMENSGCPNQTSSQRSDDEELSYPINEPNNKRSKRTTSNRKKMDEESMEKFIMSNIVTPINAISRSKPWKNSIYKYINEEDKIYRRVINNIKTQTMSYTYEDFLHLHLNNNSQFVAINTSPEEYYYDKETSFKILLDLLQFQFNDSYLESDIPINQQVSTFILDLFDILEKKKPKVNCIEVISQPSAGKNYFFDCITNFYVNIGNIANFNRNNQFPLQDAFDRRINIWNEPNCETGAYDTIKMLFGGDPCPAKVKYKDDIIIFRTPIIILSNKNCFPRDKAFNDRMIRYRWKPYQHLKTYCKYPTPLCWPMLLEWALDIKSENK